MSCFKFKIYFVMSFLLWISADKVLAKANTRESTAVSTSASADDSFHRMESEVFMSSPAQLMKLEHKVARMMQLSELSHQSHYLMSILLLRQYLQDPTDVAMLKQSASMAAQSYELNPQSELGIVALANVLEVSGEIEKGLLLLTELEKKNIEVTWRYHFVKARLLTGDEASASVLPIFRKALEDTNAIRSLIAPYVIATVLTDTRPSAMSRVIAGWYVDFPCPEFGLSLANVYLRDGNHKSALKIIKDIQKADPTRIEALVMEASIALSETKDIKYAKKLLERAAQSNPPEFLKTEIAMSIALASVLSKDSPKDVRPLIDAVKKNSNAEASIMRLSEIMIDQKRFKDALAFLESVHLEVPGIATSYGLYAEILLSQMKRNEDAVTAFSDALVLEGENSRYYNGRGLAYYGLKKIDRALIDFQYATRADPSNASARYNLACALALTGKEKEALEVLASAVSLDSRLAKQALADSDFRSLRGKSKFDQILQNAEDPGSFSDDPTSIAH